MAKPSIWNFLRDPESQRSVGNALLDAANRGMVANSLGSLVDLSTNVANLGIAGAGYIGHKTGLLSQPPELIDSRSVPGSSEWIGQKMQNAGMVSPNRNALAELGMGLLSPVAYKGAQRVGGVLYGAEQNALANLANPSTMRMQGQRGVIEFPPDMSRPEKSQAVKQMAEDAASRLRSLGFETTVDHSGSAMGPSSYVKAYDPQTGRFITDPLRISDHSKGPFNSKLVHDARGAEDIDAFVKAAQDMRSLGPSDMFKQQQADQLAQAQKVRASWMAVYERASQKQQAGQQLSNKERQAIDWVAKNGAD